jgi:hypothetical protein
MAADIVERAYEPVVAADDEDRGAGNGQRQEVAGLRNLDLESGEKPTPVPDFRHLGACRLSSR